MLKEVAIHDQLIENKNTDIDYQISASYQSYALFGMIVEWVKGGFKYTPPYMAEQLIKILSSNQFWEGEESKV